jgi:hypothetical protein
MNNTCTQIKLIELKIQARILLKSILSNDINKHKAAISRFEQAIKNPIIISNIKLKHALKVIAIENGFKTWSDLKNNYYQMIIKEFNNYYINGFLNNWFNNYNEAKQFQLQQNSYLFRFKKHFYVAESCYVEALGLKVNDQDLLLIARDFADPLDKKALIRLIQKITM